MMQNQTYLLELYRAGLRSASDIAKASLENAQRLHAQQLDALREALDANTRTASETHVALLGQVQSQVGQLSERVRETYSAATRAAEGAVNDVVESAREV